MMVTKDRLADLKSNINYTFNDQNSYSFSGNNEDIYQETFKEIAKIRQWINDIDEKTQSITELCKNSSFYLYKDVQNKIDANVVICSALGTKISGALREFEEKVNSEDANSTFFRIIQTQYMTMKQLFINVLENHEQCLKKYQNRKLSLLRQQIKLTNYDITEEECESLLESNNISFFVDNIVADTQEARLALQDVESRHKELIKIENALTEVRNLFVQMARLVSQQQDLIDTVEFHASRAQDYVDSGNRDLVKGSKNKRKSMKKKIYLTVCLVTGCSIVLAILILT